MPASRLLPPRAPGLADDGASDRDRHAGAQAADGGDLRARQRQRGGRRARRAAGPVAAAPRAADRARAPRRPAAAHAGPADRPAAAGAAAAAPGAETRAHAGLRRRRRPLRRKHTGCALGQHPAIAPACTAAGSATLARRSCAAARRGAGGGRAFGVAARAERARRGVRAGRHGAGRRTGAALGRRTPGSSADVAERWPAVPRSEVIHIVRDVHAAVRALTDPPLGSAGATGGTQVPPRLREKMDEREAVERWSRRVGALVGPKRGLGTERMLNRLAHRLRRRPRDDRPPLPGLRRRAVRARSACGRCASCATLVEGRASSRTWTLSCGRARSPSMRRPGWPPTSAPAAAAPGAPRAW